MCVRVRARFGTEEMEKQRGWGMSKDRRLKMISVNISGGQHNATVIVNDSFLFLIAMVAVA